MGKFNDVTIRGWIRSGERFEGRSDGDGLVLTWRKDTGSPFWKFRYRFAGKPRVRQARPKLLGSAIASDTSE